MASRLPNISLDRRPPYRSSPSLDESEGQGVERGRSDLRRRHGARVPSKEALVARVIVRWGFIPVVLVVIVAGVIVGRVIEAIAVASVLFAVGSYVRRWVAA
jgi:hypothetical protein